MPIHQLIRQTVGSLMLLLGVGHGELTAQPVLLKQAVIVVSPSIPSPMRETAPRMLSEEISKRTGIQLKTEANWPKSNPSRIALVLAS